jgi:hypothetical protein
LLGQGGISIQCQHVNNTCNIFLNSYFFQVTVANTGQKFLHTVFRIRSYCSIGDTDLISVADPDPVSGAFLPQGSGMIFFSDPRSRIPDLYHVPN